MFRQRFLHILPCCHYAKYTSVKRGKLTPAYLGFTTEKNNSKILNVPFVTYAYLYQYFLLLKK